MLLGERLWRRRFAADPRVVGQPVTLDGKPYTVIGVMPAHVGVGVIPRLYNDVFLPIGQYDDELFLSRHVNAIAAIGRLRPGVGLAEARAEMDTIARALAAAYPEANKGVGVNAGAARGGPRRRSAAQAGAPPRRGDVRAGSLRAPTSAT